MILQAHARDGRDILVSYDVRGFVGKNGQNRSRFEEMFATRIMTIDEFLDFASTIP